MDKAFFEQGETVEYFIENMQNNRQKFQELLAECVLTEEQRQKLAGAPKLNVVVIAEDWSGDVLYNLPVLIRMAQAAKWNVRIFHRDEYPELILPYRKDGLYHSIPVFVFYGEDWNEVNNWIERPAAATRTIDDESLALRRRLREAHKEEWRQATIEELIEVSR
jgi:hypothetical protein